MTELRQLRELLLRLRDKALAEKRDLLAYRIAMALAEVDRQLKARGENDGRQVH